MTAAPYDILSTLLTDPEVSALLGDAALARSMIAVEAALARVEGRLGVIPEVIGDKIANDLVSFEPDLSGLAAGAASAGVPVPALVTQLRRHLGGPAADWVHWGATSQDIVDTALVLQLRRVLAVMEARLDRLIRSLTDLAVAHAGTVMVARTRFQQAIPTSFGLKVAGWLAPLHRHCTRLAELKPRLFVVQFGGAAGNLAALGAQGVPVMAGLAEELGLGCPVMPWHSQRDSFVELASWASLVTGSLGKLGQDILLLAQNEVGEVREAAGGGSSTMPQKSNPILSEALVTLARRNAMLVGGMHQSLLHAHERDGTAWQLEWTSLPDMLGSTAAALTHARELARTLVVDAPRMRATLEASHGLLLAEAASFALSEQLGRNDAQKLVKTACETAIGERRNLIDVLRSEAPDLNWSHLADQAEEPPAAAELIQRVLAEVRAAPEQGE